MTNDATRKGRRRVRGAEATRSQGRRRCRGTLDEEREAPDLPVRGLVEPDFLRGWVAGDLLTPERRPIVLAAALRGGVMPPRFGARPPSGEHFGPGGSPGARPRSAAPACGSTLPTRGRPRGSVSRCGPRASDRRWPPDDRRARGGSLPEEGRR